MLITLTDDVIKKIEAFAEECVKTNKYYAARGQGNTSKITTDIIVGKMGEWAVYQLLKEKFEDVAEPDLVIYTGGRKSHSADLVANSINFSVKTQSMDSVKKYGMSWLMERNSTKKFDGHYVALCLQVEPTTILIQNIVPFSDMMAVESVPRLKHLKTKVAFYYNDMLLNKIKESI